MFFIAPMAHSDLGFFMLLDLNKNYLFKFDNSIKSLSVTYTCPYPTPRPIREKTFKNSHPKAPAPTKNVF